MEAKVVEIETKYTQEILQIQNLLNSQIEEHQAKINIIQNEKESITVTFTQEIDGMQEKI